MRPPHCTCTNSTCQECRDAIEADEQAAREEAEEAAIAAATVHLAGRYVVKCDECGLPMAAVAVGDKIMVEKHECERN